MPRATSSLPVPVSPSIKTGIEEKAGGLHQPEDLDHRGAHCDDLREAIAAREVAAQYADLGLELFGGSLDLAEPTSVLDCNPDAERQFLEQREVSVGEKPPSTRVDRLDNAQARIAS